MYINIQSLSTIYRVIKCSTNLFLLKCNRNYWNVNVLKKIKRLGFLKKSAEIERLYLIDTFINLNI